MRTVLLAITLLASLPGAAVPPAPAMAPAGGVFLVAGEAMPDPRFWHAVILLAEHGSQGTLGLIVNRPTGLTLADLGAGFDSDSGGGRPLYYGGPVALDTLLLLAETPDPPQPSKAVLGDLHISGDRGVLTALLAADPPLQRLRLYLGRAGWAPGQLQGELDAGSWLLFHADAAVVFADDPGGLWDWFMEHAGPGWQMAAGP